jgi:hypothetical protein
LEATAFLSIFAITLAKRKWSLKLCLNEELYRMRTYKLLINKLKKIRRWKWKDVFSWNVAQENGLGDGMYKCFLRHDWQQADRR